MSIFERLTKSKRTQDVFVLADQPKAVNSMAIAKTAVHTFESCVESHLDSVLEMPLTATELRRKMLLTSLFIVPVAKWSLDCRE